MKKIAILGITGSIGQSCLNIIRNHKKDFKIVFATAHSNGLKLKEICNEFDIKESLLTNKNNIISKKKSILQQKLTDLDYDIVINAISGSAGLLSSFTALQNGKTLALANKESLVMAGHVLIPLSKKNRISILPVDSEHSAVLQALSTHKTHEVEKIILTASGGPFRKYSLEQIANANIEQALNHPNWKMGKKISIDSATMMNKGLEVIEAHWLFDMPYNKIEAIIHPQSIIHSLVEFVDGSLIAQMSQPSMELPILYALGFPKRIPSNNIKTNLLDLKALTFEKLDFKKYPLFELALQMGKDAGIFPTIMNSANEAAINLFLNGKITFVEISQIIINFCSNIQNVKNPQIDELIDKNEEVFRQVSMDYKLFLK